MTAAILPFPHRPVRVVPARDGGWLVVWRSCGWLHGSRNAALADAHAIAAAHGVPINRSALPEKQQEKAMVEQYDDSNRGALFRELKEKETDRDYSGKLNVAGVDYWISGWLKTSKKGVKYMSLSVKPTNAGQSKPQARRDSMDDEIPF